MVSLFTVLEHSQTIVWLFLPRKLFKWKYKMCFHSIRKNSIFRLFYNIIMEKELVTISKLSPQYYFGKLTFHQKPVLNDVGFIIYSCDTVKTLESICERRAGCRLHVWSSFPAADQSKLGTWMKLFMETWEVLWMKPGGGLWGGENKKKNNLGGNWFVLFIVSKRVDSVFPGDSEITYKFPKSRT